MPLPFKLYDQGLHHAKAVLGLWDPIGVPASIKVSEYEGYLGKIISAYPDVDSMYNIMCKLQRDMTGYEPKEADPDSHYIATELKRVLDFYNPELRSDKR